jgi:cephalosporin hydroxylase
MRKYWKEIPGSMFDFKDFYQKIADSLPNNARIIEIGVADGKSAIFLAEALANQNKNFEMILVDSLDYGKTDQLNTIIDHVVKSGLSHLIKILPIDSLNASLKFNEGWAHFIFIDSGHTYELTKAEIRLWHRKLVDGRYLAGHDFTSIENPGVGQAVSELVPSQHLEVFPTENNCGVWAFKKNPDVVIK